MKFAELSKQQQREVLEEIAKEFRNNGLAATEAVLQAKAYIEDIDGRFTIIDYSPDEDGSDLRVEW